MLTVTDTTDIATSVRRGALRFSIEGAPVSVPLMWMVMVVMLLPPWRAHQMDIVAGVGLLALINGLWRLSFIQRLPDLETITEAQLRRAEIEIQASAVFGGVMWFVATLWIYPTLAPRDAAVHVMLLAGSNAMAAVYTSMMGYSYMLLSVPMMIPLIGLSLFDPRCQSTSIGLVSLAYQMASVQMTRRFRASMLTSLQRKAEAEITNRQLSLARDKAEAATQAKSQFLAVMSHEIRTPMNGVLGTLELLARRTQNPDQQRLVRIARTSSLNLLHVLNDVLDYSKLEAGQQRSRLEPVAVQALARQVMDLFQASAEAKGLQLLGQWDAATSHVVLADARHLQQVLMNLMGNAVKFTDQGTVTLRIQHHPDNQVRIELADTGPGFDATAHQRLFQPFQQLDDRLQRRHDGTGLGLAISQRLMGLMGSAIDVTSTPGQGSCFGFSLASAELARTNHAFESSDGDRSFAPLKGHVLVVEDNATNRMITLNMLQALGLTAQEAADGQQALLVMAQERFALVLMDLHMPELDGYAATSAWREIEKRTGHGRLPILALTANVIEKDLAHALTIGMDGHLTKPCSLGTLHRALSQWLPKA